MSVSTSAAEGGDFFFEFFYSFGVHVGSSGAGGLGDGEGFDVDLAGEEVGEAGFFLAGLDGQFDDERVFATHEAVEGFLDLAEAGEGVKAFAASAEFAERLRAAEQQFGNYGSIGRLEFEDAGEHVLVLRHAARAAVEDVDEIAVAKDLKAIFHRLFVVFDDRVAIALLVARVDQGV